MKKLSNSIGISFFITLLGSFVTIAGGFMYCFFTEKSMKYPFELVEFVTESADNGGHFTSIVFGNSLFLVIGAIFVILALLIFLMQTLLGKKKEDVVEK